MKMKVIKSVILVASVLGATQSFGATAEQTYDLSGCKVGLDSRQTETTITQALMSSNALVYNDTATSIGVKVELDYDYGYVAEVRKFKSAKVSLYNGESWIATYSTHTGDKQKIAEEVMRACVYHARLNFLRENTKY